MSTAKCIPHLLASSKTPLERSQMAFAFFLFRRTARRAAGLAGLVCFLSVCFGCGSSSSPGTASNGNSGSSTGIVSATTGSTTGGSDGSGFSGIPAGVLLASAGLPLGTWGGSQNVDGGPNPGSLQVSGSGGQFMLDCGLSAHYAGNLVLDSQGRFLVQGTGDLNQNPLAPAGSGQVLFSGQVGVSTAGGKSVTSMVLTVSDAVSGIGYGTYTLILGDKVDFTNPCQGSGN